MNSLPMERVIGGKRYSTDNATLIADDVYWNGHNFERHFRNRFLFKTPNGSYFLQTRTQWESERDSLEPLAEDEAISLYEKDLPEHYLEFEESFVGVAVEEA